MHGTAKSNEENQNFAKAGNVLIDQAFPLLDEYNVLRGTEYKDLIAFFKYLNPIEETIKEKKDVPVIPKSSHAISMSQPLPTAFMTESFSTANKGRTKKHNPRTKFEFIIDGKIRVHGQTNKEAIIDLIKTIGIDNARVGLWKSLFSPVQTKDHTTQINGVFLNTRISARDMIKIFANFRKAGLNYQYVPKHTNPKY
jgi:hypothetical protein